MVKIQIDLTDEENRIVDVYKIANRLKTKQEAIKSMITHFEVVIKPKNVKEDEYFK
jgi:hypothetical protein